jgi:uncharacterized repeat protein (TIGR01451 family)
MHVGVLPLLGSLAVGGPVAPPTSGGVLPVPGMGPPGAVAAFGAIVPRPGPGPGEPLPAPAPLVAAKFLTPKGVRVTAFPGSDLARMYDAPAVLGLRPGYVYRFELSNLPYFPNLALYPEVELRGVLVPRPGMKYMDYPIPLTFSLADLARAAGGAVVTKVIYLEDPEKAIPAETTADAPIELPDDTETAAFRGARENGRLMAVVRLGNRKPPADELRRAAVDGTILLPGEKYLKAPAAPPAFEFWGVPLFDPILGPRGPKEECLVNGDDKGAALGIGPGGVLGGLDVTDVGVEYTSGGKRKVTTSCVVCICAPRYVIRRVELLPVGILERVGPVAHVGRERPLGFVELAPPGAVVGREKPTEFVGRVRPSAYVGQVGTSLFIGTTRPTAVAQVFGVKVEATYVEPVQLTAYPTLCPLTVTKVVDPPGAKQSGDVVTITIRYSNTGAKPADDLVVSDSLSARLEYVAGSAQSDRAANFTTAENEAGSVVLRWELPGTLLPGQSGTIKFKAKVR